MDGEITSLYPGRRWPVELDPARMVRLPAWLGLALLVGGAGLALAVTLAPAWIGQYCPSLHSGCRLVLSTLALLGGGVLALAGGRPRLADAAALAALACVALGAALVPQLPLSPEAPGLSTPALLGLALAGGSLLLLPRAASAGSVFVLVGLLATVSVIGVIDLLGHLLTLVPLAGRAHPLVSMSPLGSAGLLATAAALFRLALGMPGVAGVFHQRPDRTVFAVSAVALLAVLTSGAVAAIGLFADGAPPAARWPLRQILWATLVPAGLMALCGAWLIHRHVRILVRGLARAESYLVTLLGSMPLGVVAAGPDGRITSLNPAAAAMFGLTQEAACGRPVTELLPGLTLPPAPDAASGTLEHEARRADGQPFPAEVTVRSYRFEARSGLLLLVQDITARHAVDSALRETERALNRAQAVAEVGSWTLDLHRQALRWSDETYRLFGVPRGAPLDYAQFIACVHPDDRAAVDAAWHAALAGAPYDIEHRLAGPERRWVRERAEIEFDGEGRPVGATGTVQDITERKLREAELLSSRAKLRALAAHHEKVREEERAHIAREIHDELGQHLTALRMDIALLQLAHGAANPALAQRVDAMKGLVDRTIAVVRSVASSLRPAALDLGLVSAAEWLVGEFQARSGVACRLVLPPGELALDDARATVVFRILQESLTNITRHARASRVDIRIGLAAAGLWLEVEDDGQGFDPSEVRTRKTFGLMGIRERALMFGGSARITSQPGLGTLLRVEIPLEAEPAPEEIGA